MTPGTNPASTGLQVIADLNAVAVFGLFDQPLFDDGIAPDAAAGDNVFTTTFVLNPALSERAYSFAVFVTDAEGRGDFENALLTVVPPPVIYLPHDVQGPGATSPLLSAAVVVEGVVTARKSNGFFIQTAPGSEDADPNSSEGLFVFTGSAPSPTTQAGSCVSGAPCPSMCHLRIREAHHSPN